MELQGWWPCREIWAASSAPSTLFLVWTHLNAEFAHMTVSVKPQTHTRMISLPSLGVHTFPSIWWTGRCMFFLEQLQWLDQ